MIQRIQTVFLFLATVFAGILFFTPMLSFTYGEELMKLTILGVDNANEALQFSGTYSLPLLLVTILAIVVPFFTIFKYNKREFQMKLCSLNVFLNAVICGLVFLYYASNVEKRIESESIQYLF